MVIKYNKYVKTTITRIPAGVIELFGIHIEKVILSQYENLPIGIGIYPKFPNSIDFALLRAQSSRGMYFPKTNEILVKVDSQSQVNWESTLRHELIHACQHISEAASSEIEDEAKKSSKWKNSEEVVKRNYPPSEWQKEIPAWTLEGDKDICQYFINKYLK